MSGKIIGLHFLAVLIYAVILAGCNGGGTPVEPAADQSSDLPEASMSSGQSRDVIAVYDAVIDPIKQTFTIELSARDLSYHGALTRLYPQALTIANYGWSPNFWVDITLTHPLPNSRIIVFDPRVIAILPANPGLSFNYPVLDCVGNNTAVLEPDGYTKLHDNLGGSIPGNTNPFKAYFKTQPNRRWMDIGVSSETQRWQMNLSGLPVPFAYKLVVDISTNYPQLPTPGVDNAPEPVSIEATIGLGLTTDGGSALIKVTLLDWQGSSNIKCEVESPQLFDSTIQLLYSRPGPNPHEYIFSGTISNSLLPPAGIYSVLISAWDTPTDIRMFSEVKANVNEPLPVCGNLIGVIRGGGSDYDRGMGIATLSDNSIIVTGEYSTYPAFGETDIFIARINTNGVAQWARHAGSVSIDGGYAITALSDDSAIIAGQYYENEEAIFGLDEVNETILPPYIDSWKNLFIARYNSDGSFAWAKRMGGSVREEITSLSTLPDDSIVATGDFSIGTIIFGEGEINQTELSVEETIDGIFIAKYNPDGTLAWAKTVGTCDWIKSNGITTLNDGSIIITGNFGSSSDYTATFGEGDPNETVLTTSEELDIFIARYNNEGTLAWAKSAGGRWQDSGLGIALLSDNSFAVTGYFRQTATFGSGEPNETDLTSAWADDIFIARYNPDGTLVWAKRAGGENLGSTECGYGITTLPDDSTIVTGDFTNSATFGPGEVNETILTSAGASDIFVARYNPNGTLAWAKCAGGPNNDHARAITALPDNSTVVTGYFCEVNIFGPGEPNETVVTSDGIFDIFVARFDP